MPTVALIARYPVAGEAKTRLIPALGPDGAAALHRRLVERTVAVMLGAGLPFEVRFTGAAAADFAEWLGADVPLAEQGDGDLGDRMGRVAAPAILVGADIPDLDADMLRSAAVALAAADVVIGPAEDGGYYLLGFREPVPFLFTDMDWGTGTVLAETLRRLAQRGLSVTLLPVLADLDRPEDLARWPDL